MGRVTMIENASRKGAGALENMIGPESVHHVTKIMGGGEKRIEASLMKYTNGQAKEGGDSLLLKTHPTHPEFRFPTFHQQHMHESRRENFLLQPLGRKADSASLLAPGRIVLAH